MVDFKYSAFLPSLNKRTLIKEINFTTYKQLVKLIHNNDNVSINSAFNEIIQNCTTDDINNYTFLDKLIVLLTMRSVCIFPQLELTFNEKDANNQTYNFVYEIYNIIENISTLDFYSTFNSVKHIYNDNIKITYGIPANLYYETEDELVLSTIKEIYINNEDITHMLKNIIESLPAVIYKDARQHIKNIEKEIDKLSLLSVKTKSQEDIEYKPSIITGSVLEFLKLCFKKDLISLYEMEYVLTSKLNVPHTIVSHSTFAELMIYIGFYNEEKKVREQEERNKNTNPLAANR
jgi:hypothetical protein